MCLVSWLIDWPPPDGGNGSSSCCAWSSDASAVAKRSGPPPRGGKTRLPDWRTDHGWPSLTHGLVAGFESLGETHAVRADWLVELRGFEPLTSAVRLQRSPI